MNTVAEQKKASVSLVPAARLQEARALSQIAQQCQAELIENDDSILRAVIIAQAINQLREKLTPAILSDFRALMNTPIGFRTDRPNAKNREPYDDAVLKDCLIQGMIRGLRPVANEINILAGNLYCTKEGFRRLLREFPGFANLAIRLGTPKAHGEGCICDCSATWTLHGEPQSIDCTGQFAIPVKRNESMGIDAILGKAESKLLRRIYSQLIGSDWAPMDVGSADEADGPDAS